MLTPADDYPLHQTADPIAFAGTDRNFYDRFFFNGLTDDGETFFACAFGIYPQLDIMDGAFSIMHKGKQHNLRASKHMNGDRLHLKVGPISVEIIRPLNMLRVKVSDNETGLRAYLTFMARAEPIEEPRFTRRIGTRSLMDYTRMTQNGIWAGQISVDGDEIDIRQETCRGTRDRSWGVRPVGKSDSQPPAAGALSQFFWLWTPANFPEHAAFCHTNDDAHGRPWNRRGVIQPVGGEEIEFEDIDISLDWNPGTRRVDKAVFDFNGPDGQAQLRYKTGPNFYMMGIGYTHPEWGHGHDRGPHDTTYDILNLDEVDDNNPGLIHIQSISTVELDWQGDTHKGAGVVEQMFIGPHEGFGLTGLMDPIGG